MQLKLLALVLVFLVSVTSCTKNIKSELSIDDSVKVFIKENKKSYGPFMVLASSKEYQRLQGWLKNNKSGWSQTNLVPFDSMLAPIEILSNSFVIKVWDEKVYLKENKRVLVKSIEKGSFKYIMELKE